MKRKMFTNIKIYIKDLGIALLAICVEVLLLITTGVALLFRLIATPFELLAAVVDKKTYIK